MRVLITGGGTGGHLYPALAVARALKERDPQVKVGFVGTRAGLEKRVVPAQGLPFWEVPAARLPRRPGREMLSFPFVLASGYRAARSVVREFSPHVVFATGGYVSAPLVLAAARERVPVVLHEQNYVPGLANLLLGAFAAKICTTFPWQARLWRGKVVHTGLPVRPEVLRAGRAEGAAFLGLRPDLLTLLVMGGSQGARRVNELMLAFYGHAARRGASLPSFQVIHLTGREQYAWVCAEARRRGIEAGKIGKLIIKPYLEEIWYALAAADLVVSRAGAATLAEVTVRGLPAVLIPYPHAAGNHQYHNALYLARSGAAVLLPEQEATPEVLVEVVGGQLRDAARRQEMGEKARAFSRPRAGEEIAGLVLGLGGARRR